MLRISVCFIFALVLTTQSFNLDFFPRRSKALLFENMFNENALDRVLAGLVEESSLRDRSAILEALKKNVEDQIMKEFGGIPAATQPRLKNVRRKNLKNLKKTWYSRIS